jgi:hypothetical protein
MKSRSCNLSLTIANDAGQVSRYALTPLAARELGPDFVAGFRLVNRSVSPSLVYHLRLNADAVASCTCPAFVKGSACKHASAALAAGLLPARLMEVLAHNHRLLDHAEERVAEANRQAATALAETERIASEAGTERQVHEYDAEAMRQQIRELEGELADLRECALRLQTSLAAVQSAPPRRRQPRTREAAA